MSETPLEKNLREINERQEREELRRQGKLPGQAKEEAKEIGAYLGILALGVVAVMVFLLLLIKIVS